MSPDPPLGVVIPPCDELLFRQIHPDKFSSKGQPAVGNFLPVPVPGKSNFVPEDKYNLSTRREAIGAQGAYEAHLEEGGRTAGTWGVTVREAHEVDPGLPVYDDEGLGPNPLPRLHATIRFPEVPTSGQREAIARKLWRKAQQRGDAGWLYRPAD